MAPDAQRKRATSTSAFGVSRRENHDASGFYARFTAPTLSDDDTVEPPGVVDQIYVGDARSMDRVRPSSVALVVTSPPYFAGKAYEEELGEGHIPATYVEYLTMLEDVFAECVDKLEAGGRIAVNVANLGRKPYRSLSADVIGILQDRLGLLLRGEVVWRKARGAGGNCAWGSFKQPANPVLRDLTERVVIASKGRFDRAVKGPLRAQQGLPFEASTTADEFMDATLDVWELAPESATRVGHPAPFPVELPQRLIDLYTYREDVVLDPFMGSGTTAVAAVRTGRHYLGYDTDDGYAQAARERVAAEVARAVTVTCAGEARQGGHRRPRRARRAPGSPWRTPRSASAAGSPAASRSTGSPPMPQGAEWLVLVAGASTVASQRAAAVRRAVPHARRGGGAHHRRPPGARCSPPTSRRRGRRPLGAVAHARGVAAGRRPRARRLGRARPPGGLRRRRRHRTGRRAAPRSLTPPVPSAKTEITEIVTGLAITGAPTLETALAAQVRSPTWATPCGRAWSSWSEAGQHRQEFAAAWANGQAFLHADQGLRGRPPAARRVEGPHPGAGRRGGAGRPPRRPRVAGELQVPVEGARQRRADPAVRPRPGRRALPARLATGTPRWRPTRTRRSTRPVRVDLGTRASVPPARASTSRRRTAPSCAPTSTRAGRPRRRRRTARWPSAVGQASAERWRRTLTKRGDAEAVLWRLLRIGSAPYFVLGAQRDRTLRLRMMTPWDWRQAFELKRFDVWGDDAGQPQVRWQAVDPRAGHRRGPHGRRPRGGPLEPRPVREAPEAKAYLDTPHHRVPGYVTLM